MGYKTETRRKQRTFIYLWVLIALSVLLVAATYTWFALSQTPRVNDMAIYVNADSGLELAKTYNAADDKWGQELDFLDLVNKDYPLKPATWSNERQRLVTVQYGFDGRSTGEWIELTDFRNANQTGVEGYYVVGTFYARSDAPCKVSLAEAVEVNEGENGFGTYVIGSPEWDDEQILHYDDGAGAEMALRLGFRISPIRNSDGAVIGDPEFFIYEPNCDGHVNGSEGYVPTPSIDGAETLIDEDHLILQSNSSWEEAYPVQEDITIKNLGKFISNKTLFSLKAGEKVKIELYVWLEGQDADCINKIDAAKLIASIQFHVEYTGQSGMVEIED